MNATQSLAGWMLYAMCLSAVIGLVSAGAEEALRRRGMSVRVLWGVSLAAAMLLPLLVWVSVRGQHPNATVPDVAPAGGSVATAQVADGTPARAGSIPDHEAKGWSAFATWRNDARIPNLTRLDTVAGTIATTSPLVCALWLFVAWLRLRAQRRDWREGLVDGASVLLSSNFGPAIVGLRRPRIVVPEWAMRLSEPERRLMIAHEREHLAAHDGRTVTMALCAIALMPWNVALWRLVRRLRLAVELDCDSRVLRATPDVKQYGVLLLEVARHTPAGSAMVAALVERPSALRRRIEAMTARDCTSLGHVLRDISGITFATAAFCIVAPPRAQTFPAAPRSIARERAPEPFGQRSSIGLPPAVRGSAQEVVPMDSGVSRRETDAAAAPEPTAAANTAQPGSIANDIIRGLVSALDGTPIENVPVMAVDQLSGVMISSRTNADGRYTLFVANGDGDYLVTVAAEGYRDTTVAVKRGAPEQVLVANVTLTKSHPSTGDARHSAPTLGLPADQDSTHVPIRPSVRTSLTIPF